MGLEQFNTDDLDEGEKYYEATLGCEAVIVYPGLYDKLPRDIRECLHISAQYKDEGVKVKMPFWVEGRGRTRPQALQSARDKMNRMEEQEFDNELAEVVQVGVRHGMDRVEEKVIE